MSKFKKKIKYDILNELDTPDVLESIKNKVDISNVQTVEAKPKRFSSLKLARVLTIGISFAALVIVGILILPSMSMKNASMSDKQSNWDMAPESKDETYGSDIPIYEPGSTKDGEIDSDESKKRENSEITTEDVKYYYYSNVITEVLSSDELIDLYDSILIDIENNKSLDEIIEENGNEHIESITLIYNYLTK